MKLAHFEVIRQAFLKKLDFKRMFAVWRVDAPWQACTKRVGILFFRSNYSYFLFTFFRFSLFFTQPIGFTLGGGKGNIHHYVTPVAPNRVIVEVGGKCEFLEVSAIITKSRGDGLRSVTLVK